MKYSLTPTILYLVLLVLLVIGAFMELGNPKFIHPQMKYVVIYLTTGILGLFISFYVLMFLLSYRNREGFENKDIFDEVKTILTENKLEEICKVYDEIYQKIFKVQKGIPPESFTDEQAREKTAATMKKEMTLGPVSCPKVKTLQDAVASKDIDALFTVTQELPNSFLAEAFDTAKGCRAILKKNVDEVKLSVAAIKESFVDVSVGICSPEVTEERRKFLREQKLSEKAQSCLLPEEVPLDKKDGYIQSKLNKIKAAFEEYLKTEQTKETIQSILEDCSMYKKELDKFKQQAESGTLIKT